MWTIVKKLINIKIYDSICCNGYEISINLRAKMKTYSQTAKQLIN